jgi:hypothetical protein
MIPEQAVEAAANAISECSGMRFDGFWSRIDDLEPEDREHAVKEARAALEAAAPYLWAQALDEIAQLIRNLTDPDPCSFDHHGGCQAHGYLSLQPEEKCPQQTAKEFIAATAREDRR